MSPCDKQSPAHIYDRTVELRRISSTRNTKQKVHRYETRLQCIWQNLFKLNLKFCIFDQKYKPSNDLKSFISM